MQLPPENELFVHIFGGCCLKWMNKCSFNMEQPVMVGYPGLRIHVLGGHNFWASYDKI